MIEAKKRVFMPKVETKLTRQDFKRVDDLAKVEGKTKSEVVREAVLWYLDHVDDLKNEPRDTVIAQAIDGMANRVCAMLARQGRQIGTVFELTYSQMSRTKEGRASFEAASSTANQKQNRAVTKDERELVDAMKKKVKGQSE
ncbi:MAG TPA: ribbon-helix-helix protein, CopG family [Oculatellaceae cyanobacterium]